MSTTQNYSICDSCGEEYMYEFNLKTGKRDKITQCHCDIEITVLKSKLDDEGQKCAVLMSGLLAIAECTDEDGKKVAQETLEAFAARWP